MMGAIIQPGNEVCVHFEPGTPRAAPCSTFGALPPNSNPRCRIELRAGALAERRGIVRAVFSTQAGGCDPPLQDFERKMLLLTMSTAGEEELLVLSGPMAMLAIGAWPQLPRSITTAHARHGEHVRAWGQVPGLNWREKLRRLILVW